MRNRLSGNKYALEVRVDYVESKLDESIKSLKESFKEINDKSEARHNETIRSLREAIDRSEARLEADRKATEARLEADREIALKRQEATEARLEADRKAAEDRLANDRLEFEKRFAEERKEWHSTKRWLYLNFGGVIALIITVVLALMNGTIPR